MNDSRLSLKLPTTHGNRQMTHSPSKIAPSVSKMEPSMHACRNVKTFAPTDVPNVFATSFAPIPSERIKATKNPAKTIHANSGGISMAAALLLTVSW